MYILLDFPLLDLLMHDCIINGQSWRLEIMGNEVERTKKSGGSTFRDLGEKEGLDGPAIASLN